MPVPSVEGPRREANRSRIDDDAGERITYYLTAIRDLQYRQPAFNDVLLQTYPHSQQLMEICRVGSEANEEFVAAARASGALRPEFTASDLHALVVNNALALKHGKRPPRADYDRRTMYLLDGTRGRASAPATYPSASGAACATAR